MFLLQIAPVHHLYRVHKFEDWGLYRLFRRLGHCPSVFEQDVLGVVAPVLKEVPERVGQNHKSADPVDFLAEGLDRVQSAGIAGYVVVKSQGDDVAQGRVRLKGEYQGRVCWLAKALNSGGASPYARSPKLRLDLIANNCNDMVVIMQDGGGLIEPSFEVPVRLEPLPSMVTLPTNIGYQTRPPVLKERTALSLRS